MCIHTRVFLNAYLNTGMYTHQRKLSVELERKAELLGLVFEAYYLSNNTGTKADCAKRMLDNADVKLK